MKRVKITGIGLIVVIVLWFAVIYPFIGHSLSEELVVIPTKTERVDGRYLVFTNKGVFKDVDDYRFLKFNSSDVYAKINGHLNTPMRIKVTGFRIPLFSMYKNIITVEQLK